MNEQPRLKLKVPGPMIWAEGDPMPIPVTWGRGGPVVGYLDGAEINDDGDLVCDVTLRTAGLALFQDEARHVSIAPPPPAPPDVVGELRRIDATFWPESGEWEVHGHDDLLGDTAPLPVPPEVAAAALAAVAEASVGNPSGYGVGCSPKGCP